MTSVLTRRGNPSAICLTELNILNKLKIRILGFSASAPNVPIAHRCVHLAARERKFVPLSSSE